MLRQAQQHRLSRIILYMFKDVPKLVERCIQGEKKAWEEFIEHFSGLLYYSARERLKRNGIAFGEQDIEDIVQSVFLEILEKGRLKEIREREKISSWLSIVAQTRALNYIRQKRERLLRGEEFYRIDNIRVDTQGHIEEGLLIKLEEIIEGFDEREKIVLKMNIIYGKTHKEIAGFMNISINTVSTIIARRKKVLKEKLKDF